MLVTCANLEFLGIPVGAAPKRLSPLRDFRFNIFLSMPQMCLARHPTLPLPIVWVCAKMIVVFQVVSVFCFSLVCGVTEDKMLLEKLKENPGRES